MQGCLLSFLIKKRLFGGCSLFQVYLLVELTTGGELFLFMEKMGRLQEWEAAFYAGSVLLAYVPPFGSVDSL
jgi:hypothetical protein